MQTAAAFITVLSDVNMATQPEQECGSVCILINYKLKRNTPELSAYSDANLKSMKL
jgi:hypothetical protein